MIVIAALLVLLGLGLFVGGLLTGTTALYWACVGACVVAAAVLVVARRQIAARAGEPAGAAAAGATASAAATGAPAAPATPATTPDAGPAATGPDLATGATAVPPATPPAAEPAPPTVEPVPSSAEPAPPSAEPVPAPPVEHPAAPAGPLTGGHAAVGRPREQRERGEPPVEEVEVTDLLIIVDLTDEVLVVDEHPRYHVPGCVHLQGHEAIPLPLDEARTDGFTPCGVCRPDRQLADRARARKARGA
ncbi:hypothetical protein ACI79P_09890 [Blastococcus sp. SYSU DS0510]